MECRTLFQVGCGSTFVRFLFLICERAWKTKVTIPRLFWVDQVWKGESTDFGFFAFLLGKKKKKGGSPCLDFVLYRKGEGG